MKIYEYIHNDINDQNYYYTPFSEDFEGWSDRSDTGRTLEIDFPAEVSTKRNGVTGYRYLCYVGTPCYISKRNGRYYLTAYSEFCPENERRICTLKVTKRLH